MGHSIFDDASRNRAACNKGKKVGTKRPSPKKIAATMVLREVNEAAGPRMASIALSGAAVAPTFWIGCVRSP
jgi:hypothetical protein